MSTNSEAVENILLRVAQLEADARLRLIQRIIDTLIDPVPARSGHPLIYGEFSGAHMSTEEDFGLAEWHPVDHELDGA